MSSLFSHTVNSIAASDRFESITRASGLKESGLINLAKHNSTCISTELFLLIKRCLYTIKLLRICFILYCLRSSFRNFSLDFITTKQQFVSHSAQIGEWNQAFLYLKMIICSSFKASRMTEQSRRSFVCDHARYVWGGVFEEQQKVMGQRGLRWTERVGW